jgi:hypothetical protein
VKEDRYDKHGRIRLMAEADGYVMVRRPRAYPFVLSRKEFDALPLQELVEAPPDREVQG